MTPPTLTAPLPSPGANVTVPGVYVRDGRIVGYARYAPMLYAGTPLSSHGSEDGQYLADYDPEARRLAAETPVEGGQPLAAWLGGCQPFESRVAYRRWAAAWRAKAGRCPCCGQRSRAPDLAGCTGHYRCPACGDRQHRRPWTIDEDVWTS